MSHYYSLIAFIEKLLIAAHDVVKAVSHFHCDSAQRHTELLLLDPAGSLILSSGTHNVKNEELNIASLITQVNSTTGS